MSYEGHVNPILLSDSDENNAIDHPDVHIDLDKNTKSKDFNGVAKTDKSKAHDDHDHHDGHEVII